MSIIQGGRWESYFRRMFSLKGETEPQSVSPEIIGTASVIPERPEDDLLRGDRLFHGSHDSTTAAANNGHVNIQNISVDSLVIVEQAWVHQSNTAGYSVRLGNVTLGTGPLTIGGRDTRLGITLTGKAQAGVIRYGHEAAISGTHVQTLLGLGSTMLKVGCPIILAPGDVLIVWCNNSNQVFNATFLWRERLAEPGELNVV